MNVKGLKQYQAKYEECFRDGQTDEIIQKNLRWNTPQKTSLIDCLWISARVLTENACKYLTRRNDEFMNAVGPKSIKKIRYRRWAVNLHQNTF